MNALPAPQVAQRLDPVITAMMMPGITATLPPFDPRIDDDLLRPLGVPARALATAPTVVEREDGSLALTGRETAHALWLALYDSGLIDPLRLFTGRFAATTLALLTRRESVHARAEIHRNAPPTERYTVTVPDPSAPFGVAVIPFDERETVLRTASHLWALSLFDQA